MTLQFSLNDLFPTYDWSHELSGESRLRGGSRDQAESALFLNGRWEPAVWGRMPWLFKVIRYNQEVVDDDEQEE